jgi:hypothetical protein
MGTLGTTPVNIDFSFTSNFILENSVTTSESILNVEVLYDSEYINYTINPTSVSFTGNIPLDIFDRYKLTYVDKGKSDKIQTPMVVTIDNMPDNKDLFKIEVDTRQTINIPITINIELEKTTLGLTPAEDTVEIINIIINYTLVVSQSFSYIKDWVSDYFENRY